MSNSRTVRTYSRKDMKKSGRSNRLSKMVIALAIALVIAVFIILFSPLSSIRVSASTDNITYETYVVQPGDTLWSIAEEHLNDTYPTYAEYINEVARANDLDSDMLQEKQLLIIPVSCAEE